MRFLLLIALSSDESSDELAQMCILVRTFDARINATDRYLSQYMRFWYCDEGSGEPVQILQLKSHVLAQMVIGVPFMRAEVQLMRAVKALASLHINIRCPHKWRSNSDLNATYAGSERAGESHLHSLSLRNST